MTEIPHEDPITLEGLSPNENLSFLQNQTGVQITMLLTEIANRAAVDPNLSELSPENIAQAMTDGTNTAADKLTNRLTIFIQNARDTGASDSK